MRHRYLRTIVASMTALSAAGLANAQDAETNDLVDAITGGKFDVNLRFRYEFVNQQGIDKEANALTFRPRVGYTTGTYEGLSAKLSVQANMALDDDAYNSTTNGATGYPTILDPVDAGVDQLWINYDLGHMNDAMPGNIKLGRQIIALDDQRFVGHVAWRNLWQSFDAVTATVSPVDDLDLFYGYVNKVNRIPGPDADADFNSDSHLINASYKLEGGHKITGFAYLLDLESDAGAPLATSSQTYGFRYVGKATLSDDYSLAYTASYAFQSDYGDNPGSYDADYVQAELKAIRGDWFASGGIEILGADPGNGAFSTPLATLHGKNGWADKFLATPSVGLRDYSASVGTKLPNGKTTTSVIYHYFTGDRGGAEFLGQEIDAVLVHPINDNTKTMLKAAYFAGNGGTGAATTSSDVFKLWAQLEFTF